jgi:acyl-CoA thioester hydrolase
MRDDAPVSDEFRAEYHAQWGDMDFNQHMANSRFLDYASDARMLFLESVGLSMDALTALRIGPVTLEDHLTYRREIRMLQRFTVDYHVVACTPDWRRFRIRNAVTTAEHGLCATVEARAIWVDLDERRPVRPPQEVRDAMAHLPRSDDFEAWG